VDRKAKGKKSVRWGYWRGRLVSGKSTRYALQTLSLIRLQIQIIQKLIDRFGLPWAYRFMALSFMVFGIVRLLQLLPLMFALTTYIFAQPAALVLKQGVRPRPPSEGAQTTKEPSIYRSANFIRLLLACFIVSYPFFIPAFVSRRIPSSLLYAYASGTVHPSV
jgi:hypothetical protein